MSTRINIKLADAPDDYNKSWFSRLVNTLELQLESLRNPAAVTTSQIQIINNSGSVVLDAKIDTTSGNTHIVVSNLPTSASGLATGTIYNDSGTLKVA